MSSILKALRKIEEEKRINQNAAPNLMSDQGFSQVRGKPLLFLAAGIALGAAMVGLVFLWPADELTPVVNPLAKAEPGKTAVTIQEPQSVPEEVLVKEVVTPAVVEDSAQNPELSGQGLKSFAASGEVSGVALQPVTVEAVEQLKTTPPKQVAPAVSTAAKKPESQEVLARPAKPMQAPEVKDTVNQPSSAASELPDGVTLLVSEIFFQEDSANSMAVVNDLPVMVGTLVDNAVVAEIRPDSVLFEVSGTTYEVDRSYQ